MSEKEVILLKEFQNLLKNFNNAQKSLHKITNLIEESIGAKKEKEVGKEIGIADIMELPEELRKTALAVIRLRKNATIDKIAERTGRDPSLERGFAEALVAMNVLTKELTDKGEIFRPNLGKKRPIISDDVWSLLIKDSAEMVNFICNMEIEKAEMKLIDIDEMMQMAPQLSEVFEHIKNKISDYISSLREILNKYSKGN